MPIAIVALLATVAFALACGRGSNMVASPTPTTRQINKQDLSTMPLNQSQLGGDFSTLPIDPDSGYQTSGEIANNTVDPADTPATIEASGWVASYQLDFTDPSYTAFGTGYGLVGGNSELHLFSDEHSAETFLAKQLSDAQNLVGQTVQDGTTLVSSKRFDIAAGDEGFGLNEDIADNGITAYGWVAGFRLGNLLATVQMTRGDSTDMTTTMVQLVQALETRVNGVLDGTITDTPFPLPSTP